MTIVNRQYQTSTWSTVLWGRECPLQAPASARCQQRSRACCCCAEKSGGVRHLHVAGLGWNVNASGQLNGSYWGMQSPYDGHVVQIQMPMSNTAETIWGACITHLHVWVLDAARADEGYVSARRYEASECCHVGLCRCGLRHHAHDHGGRQGSLGFPWHLSWS